MKRIGSSDSLGDFMSMCPTAEEQLHSPRKNPLYSREYQAMLEGLDEEGCVEESGHVPEKKRRLSVDQVKALERNFEVENKLEPERKVKLAQELGLQPRQVAVWFQNRRARWKTKQLERDYGVLKSSFDSLKHNYESLQQDNDALLKEIKELKAKLNEENTENNYYLSIKEEALVSESDNEHHKTTEAVTQPSGNLTVGSKDAKSKGDSTGSGSLAFAEFKDGSSDSDSSAILNDDQSPNASNASSGVLQNHQLLMSPNSSSFRFNCSSSSSPPSINCFSFSDSRSDGLGNGLNSNVYHPQFVKMEEHNLFSGDEDCNFFCEDQAPTLPWY